MKGKRKRREAGVSRVEKTGNSQWSSKEKKQQVYPGINGKKK